MTRTTRMATCLDCRRELAHCHATWVRHRDGHEECLVLSCDLDGDAHVIVVSCTELDPTCCT